MTLIVDDKRRVTLPKSAAHPGDVFALETAGPGRLELTRLEKPGRKIKIKRQGRFLFASNGRPISMAQTRALLDEFP